MDRIKEEQLYLGVEIKRNFHHGALEIPYEEFKVLECYFDSMVEAKSHIRKQILPLYEPTKTLEWLKQQTGVEWEYNNEEDTLISESDWVYHIPTGECNTCAYDGKIKVINTLGYIKIINLTPQEFIEKIAKGEWV